MGLLSIVLLTVASTADSFTIGFHYGVKRVSIPGRSNFVISLICLAATFASMLAGRLAGELFSLATAEKIGASALILFGTYMLLRSLFPSHNQNYTQNPAAVDKDNSKVIELRESILAGVLLGINNIGLGICAGMAGVSFLVTSPMCAAASYLFIRWGFRLGRKFSGPGISRLLEILSAVFVLALGILSLL